MKRSSNRNYEAKLNSCRCIENRLEKSEEQNETSAANRFVKGNEKKL